MKMDWKLVKMGQVLHQDKESSVSVEPAHLYPMVGVYSFGRGLFHKDSQLGMNTSYKVFYQLKENHVVMSQLFGWEGALALSSKEFKGKYVSSQFPTFLVDESKADRDFIGFFLKQKKVWQLLFARGKGMGSRRRTLNPDSLLGIEIPLPPLSEQRRIAARLQALKRKIEEVRRLRGEQMKAVETLFNNHLVNLFHGLEKEFDTVRFIDAVNLKHGFQFRNFHFREKGVPIVKIGQIKPNGTLDLSNCSFISNEDASQFESYRIYKDDLLMALTGGTLGKVCHLKNDYGVVLQNYRVGKFEILDEQKLSKEYLYWVLVSSYFLNQVFAKINQAAQPNIGKAEMEKTKFPLPPLSEQHRIVADINSFYLKMDALKAAQSGQLSELEGLFPGVLEKAFRGEW